MSNEATYEWNELSVEQQKMVVEVHAIILYAINKKSTLTRLFNIGQPQVVIGENKVKVKYCRVGESSVDAMNVLIRQYL